MTDTPPRQSLDRLTAVMIGIVLLTLAGGYLLLSAAESLTLVDGAIEWQAESPLRAVVQLLCLNYQFPTVNAGEVKGFCLGMGTALALAALGLAVLDRSTGTDDFERAVAVPEPGGKLQMRAQHISLVTAAQLLAILYLLWSFATARWSSAPPIAVAGSALLTIQFLWALGLGNALNSRGVRYIVRGLLIVSLLCSGVAIWYYYGRNPTLRAKFPFGNPTFLAAALIPAISLALAWAVGAAIQLKKRLTLGIALWLLSALLAAVLSLWTFRLTDSRGAFVGLAASLIAMIFAGLRGKARWIPALIALVLPVAAFIYYFDSSRLSLTGRSETLRLREYAWSYATRLFAQRPISGLGQGGYTLAADSFVAQDILKNPVVFDGRIDHAHNEWLEVLTDLGVVGAALLVVVFALTFAASLRELRHAQSEHRWCLIGLTAGLFGLLVEEFAGVGLRVSEVPVVFYTLLGLIWAGSKQHGGLLAWSSRSRPRAVSVGTMSIAAALAVFIATHLDFQSARAAYQIQKQMTDGKLDEALKKAEAGLWRLSPQRSLESKYRLAETYIRWGERAIERATDRHDRARSSVPADVRLAQLSRLDVDMAEEAVRTGGQHLKTLIKESPTYLNSGFLDFRIHLVWAQSAVLREDQAGAEASRKSAIAGLERELLRQPFRTDLATSYARFVHGDVGPDRVLEVLARPLRLGPITEETAQALQQLAQGSSRDSVAQMLNMALEASTNSPETPREVRWIPELIRCSAAMAFMRGDYKTAAKQLVDSQEFYARLPRPATLGEAASYLERAEALFYADPANPQAAIENADKAIAMAPHSRLGREFQATVRQRMIQYYLAADNEALAIKLLKEAVPTGATQEHLHRELGTRLRRLSESLLLNRKEAVILLKPAESLAPRLERWLRRSLELNPTEFASWFLLADLALHDGQDQEAADDLRRALDAGLSPVDALRFLEMAMEKTPASQPLAALAAEIRSREELASEKKEP